MCTCDISQWEQRKANKGQHDRGALSIRLIKSTYGLLRSETWTKIHSPLDKTVETAIRPSKRLIEMEIEIRAPLKGWS
jgi:hypothetical protein